MMFEENTQFSPDDKKGINSNYQLTCFICGQSVCTVDNENKNSSTPGYSLSGILNHLKINSSKLSDVVPLCEKCSKVVKKLSELCVDLEQVKLKLKINYYLNELDQLIYLEENDQLSGLSNTRKDYHQLKLKLKEKCSKIKKIEPTMLVILPKLELGTDGLSSSPNLIPKLEVDITGIEDDDYEYMPIDKEEMTLKYDQFEAEDSDSGDDEQSESQTNEDEPPLPPSTSKPPPKSSAAPRKINPKKFACSECPNSFVGKPKLVEHSMTFHPSKFFPPSAYTPTPSNKLKLTPSQLNMYTIHLLNTEIDYCENSTGFKCIYCGVTFAKRRGTILTHLIKKHQGILRQELIQLQRDSSIEEIKEIVKMPAAQLPLPPADSEDASFKLRHVTKKINKLKREHSCPSCGARTTDLRRHRAHHHPEHFFKDVKIRKEMNLEVFKVYCLWVIDKHVDKIRKTSGREDGKVFGCPLCENIYRREWSCRTHIILGHGEILGEEVKKAQESKGEEEMMKLRGRVNEGRGLEVEKCGFCDVTLTRASLLIHVKKEHLEEYLKYYEHFDCGDCGRRFSMRTALKMHECKKGGGRGSRVSGENICGICKRRFASGWGLEHHQMLSHVERVFEGGKGEEVGKRFKEVCEDMMEGEMRGLVEVWEGKMRWKCGYCEESFGKRKGVWVHLVGKHKGILEGKVKRRMEEEKGGIKGMEME